MIGRRQLALVHLAKKQLGFSEDEYRAILFHHGGGVASARDLDSEGFERVMDYFARWGFKSTWRERTFGDRPGMATARQVDLIRQLWAEWSDAEDGAGLDAWIARHFGCSALRFATPAVAHKAITALKAMNRRKREAA